MSDTTTLEDRVKSLEDDIAELKHREGRKETVGECLDRIVFQNEIQSGIRMSRGPQQTGKQL